MLETQESELEWNLDPYQINKKNNVRHMKKRKTHISAVFLWFLNEMIVQLI